MDEFEIKQMNDYAISKWTNEMQIKNHEIMYNSDNVVVRLFNTYGPGEAYHPYRSVNAKFCYHAINNLPINTLPISNVDMHTNVAFARRLPLCA